MKLFTATWCEPCGRLKSWINDNSSKLSEVELCIIDIDTNPDAARAAGVKGIPALEVDGKLITTNENIRPFLTELFTK